MKLIRHLIATSSTLVCALGLFSCATGEIGTNPHHSIVGAWLVKDPNAPFPYHMYVFNADGTMQQANPDAGDPRTSDSDGKGAWVAEGASVKGRWVEVLADRVSHQFAGRTEITFHLEVTGDELSGTETVSSYDERGSLEKTWQGSADIEGKRIRPL